MNTNRAWFFDGIGGAPFLKVRNHCRMASVFFILSTLTLFSFSQNSDSIKVDSYLGGSVTVTNKGISTIPSFTLGKPAIVFDLSVSKNKLSFDPQFRFSLEGKPWSFLFWWRYKLKESDKFKMKLGAHPALAFKTIPVTTNGHTRETIIANRYLAGELNPTYFFSKGFSLGIYYLYSRGLEKDITRNTHFLSFRSNFSHIKLSDHYVMSFAPQVYYLKGDKKDGFYFAAAWSLARLDLPVSVSSMINKTIQSDVPGSQDFLWNVSLIYSFGKKYIQL